MNNGIISEEFNFVMRGWREKGEEILYRKWGHLRIGSLSNCPYSSAVIV